MKLKTLVAGAFSLALLAPVSFVEAASDTLQQLKEGGYVVLIRHTDAFRGKDRDVSNLIDCRKQRNMSFKGMEDAMNIGKAVRALDIEVGLVAASPLCRTRQTAHLAFGPGNTVPEQGLYSVCEVKQADFNLRNNALRTMLETKPEGQSNSFLITHSCNMKGVQQGLISLCGKGLEQGDALVYRPKDEGGSDFVGCISMEDWTDAAKL
ncbi:hypothetical protein N9K16_04360 [Alphaproteobacteria bacterium]|nr:hypothetical protein [Alphaproteobacteria bacterium]